MFGGVRADVDEIACREVFETLDAEVLLAQVATDQSRVGLAYFDKRLACLVMRNASKVEAFVLRTASKYRNVQHESVDSLNDARLEAREGADVADAVPRI